MFCRLRTPKLPACIFHTNIVILAVSDGDTSCSSTCFYEGFGAWGSTVVKALRYQSHGPGIDSRCCHWSFQWHISFWPYYGPGVDSAPSENEYHEHFLGVKAAGAWGWQPHHLHMPNVMKSGSLKLLEPSGPHWACYGIPLLSRLTRIEKAVKNMTIIVIYRVLMYIQISANYMFRPLLVRPSSGWIPSLRKCTTVLYNHWLQWLYSTIVYFPLSKVSNLKMA